MLDSQTKKEPTIPMRCIVLATDFLESSRLALDYAVAFSHHYAARLIIMHAFELSHEAEEAEFITHRPSLSREHALARLEGFASGVRRLGISTEIDLREGEPCAAVLTSASENNADLLVLGTHGVYRGLQHVLVGSNAEKILLASHYPTLTVGRHVMSGIDLGLGFSEILYVSDFSPDSVAAARYALALGRDLGIRTEFLPIAHEGVKEGRNGREEIERFCAELDSAGQFPNREWCDPDYLRGRIQSNGELLEHCKTRSRSLLVLGVHGQSRLDRLLRSSFAYELVAKASCPLLSVRDPANSSAGESSSASA